METAPIIEQLEFEPKDHENAARIAKALGYEQTAYTTSSDLWGLFCLAENPKHDHGPYEPGCIIKTKQFGFMFVQDLEDLRLSGLID